jgi:hypothetical protein
MYYTMNLVSAMSSQNAPSKWKCQNPKCGVPIPYNPTYDMSNVLCSRCATYDNADKLLGGYRAPVRRSV